MKANKRYLLVDIEGNYIWISSLVTEYLEEPGSYRAHKLLHTHYIERPKYNIEEN